MKINHIAAASAAAIGLAFASPSLAQMGSQTSPAQATHGLPPSNHDGGGMDHGMNDGGDRGQQAERSGHGQGDAMAMGDHHDMRGHERCRTVWHHHHKVRRCM